MAKFKAHWATSSLHKLSIFRPSASSLWSGKGDSAMLEFRMGGRTEEIKSMRSTMRSSVWASPLTWEGYFIFPNTTQNTTVPCSTVCASSHFASSFWHSWLWTGSQALGHLPTSIHSQRADVSLHFLHRPQHWLPRGSFCLLCSSSRNIPSAFQVREGGETATEE